MLRDQTERTMDMEVLDKVPMEDLNYDTIHGYRNSHRSLKEGHPFERLSDHEYLKSIPAFYLEAAVYQKCRIQNGRCCLKRAAGRYEKAI